MSATDHLAAQSASPKPMYRCILKTCPKPLQPWQDKPVWVGWTYALKDGRWTKVPVNPHSRADGHVGNASTADPKTWGTFNECMKAMQEHDLAGIGIVLGGKASGLSGGDLDDCLGADGNDSPLATEILACNEGAYIEESPSGKGLKFLTATKVEKTIKRDDLGIELYGGGRFFTITGEELMGSADVIGEAPKTVARLIKEHEDNPKPGTEAKPNGHHKPQGGDFFANVNAMALARLDAWVPVLHPTAKKQATGAWRVTSRDLNRNLEEDLSYHPDGIKDHGEEVGLTAVDAVLKRGSESDAVSAAFWLCQRMGLEPAALGWRGNGDGRKAEPRQNSSPRHGKPAHNWEDGAFTAYDLLQEEFAPVSWVVPALIPEGVTLIAGRPKIGKSWLALDLALAVAGGSFVMGGIKSECGDVLYCALEDNKRRLQKRIRKLFSGEVPKALTIKTSWRRLDQGGVEDIEDWCRKRSNPRLVLLDTLAACRPKRGKSDGAYDDDYQALSGVHRLINDRGIGLIAFHHVRKMDAEDPIDQISGTLGLGAAVDTVMVFKRAGRGATLYGRGRDVEEFEHAVEFDRATCKWRLLGNAADVQKDTTRRDILDALGRRPSEWMSPKEAAMACGIDSNLAGVTLFRMYHDGQVEKEGRGRYRLPQKTEDPNPV